MDNEPTGVVTFLFTDIEGSTKLAQDFPDSLASSLEVHHSIMREVVESNNGFVFEIIGDAFCCAFENADDAVRAAKDAQLKLHSQKWIDAPIKIRIGIHSGNAEWNGKRYIGYITLARTQRVMSAAYGEQILISNDAFELAKEKLSKEISFRDLGERRLRDLRYPIKIFQIISEGLPSDFPLLKTLDARPNNLPVQLTSFIGRESEMKEIKELLKHTHLLTLTGAGGSGKTRLALQVGADLIDDFTNGVWFAEFASLVEDTMIPQTVATALGITEKPKKTIEETLIDYLKDKQSIIILDNCEHLISGASRFAEMLLSNCAKLKIIATSREALRNRGEQVYYLNSLEIPDITIELPLEKLTQYESVKLFIERAKAVLPDFGVNNFNAPSMAGICHQLDGIPFAIELAAARVKVLSLQKIYERLNDRFTFLTGGARTALPRQQTLKALIDWSYELLPEKEKILLSRLSVFTGGWTMEAAEEICNDEQISSLEIMDLLSQLIEKSLVTLVKDRERYNMLISIRDYGKDKLEALGQLHKIQERHLSYYVKFVESAIPFFIGKKQKEWFDRIQAEHSNLQSALLFSHQEGLINSSYRLTISLGLFWEIRGFFAEATHWLEMLFEKKDRLTTYEQGHLFQFAGTFEWIKGKLSNAKGYYLECLTISRQLGQNRFIAVALGNLGMVENENGNTEEAKILIGESIKLLREIGDRKRISDALINLGTSYMNNGEYESAKTHFEESLNFFREIDDKWTISILLHNLGEIAFQKKDYKQSQALLEEGLTLQLEVGDKWGSSETLGNLGKVMNTIGEYRLARIYAEESISLKEELDDRRNREELINLLQSIKNNQDNLNKTLESKKESLKQHLFAEQKQEILTDIIDIAEILTCDGQTVLSSKLIGALDNLIKSYSNDLNNNLLTKFEKTKSEVRQKLTDKIFLKHFNESKNLSFEKMIELALSIA